MHIIRTALYTNGVWDVTGEMGRFVPPLAVFAVFTLIQRQHLTAALIFKALWLFISVQDILCFFCQMAVRYISELVVCFKRFQVGMKVYLSVPCYAMFHHCVCNTISDTGVTVCTVYQDIFPPYFGSCIHVHGKIKTPLENKYFCHKQIF